MSYMTEAALLDHISRLPHAKANFKQLIRELGARVPSRQDLETVLARLVARGDLIETRSGHFVATRSSREFAVGRLSMHRDGYGFLISDRPLEGITGDIYIPADSARNAMHGDRAVVRIARIERGCSCKHRSDQSIASSYRPAIMCAKASPIMEPQPRGSSGLNRRAR